MKVTDTTILRKDGQQLNVCGGRGLGLSNQADVWSIIHLQLSQLQIELSNQSYFNSWADVLWKAHVPCMHELLLISPQRLI